MENTSTDLSEIGNPLEGLLKLVSLEDERHPIVTVVIDTEEEFDWSKPFDREETSVSAIQEIGFIQDVFDKHGIKPVYVCDYPIVSTDTSIRILKPIMEQGRATIGAHLHSWVNPPYIETVNTTNSYQGNLPQDMEHRKLCALTDEITRNFGVAPKIHKAGRYGIGINTINSLSQLGYLIDMSAMPGFNLSGDGGPSFVSMSNDLGVFEKDNSIVEIPTTGGIIGMLASLNGYFERQKAEQFSITRKVYSLLGKLRLIERIRLSPEGHSETEMFRLAKALCRSGHKVVCLSLHSPSLKPGCTSYVKSVSDRTDLVRRTDQFLDRFFNELGGVPMDPEKVRELVLRKSTAPI